MGARDRGGPTSGILTTAALLLAATLLVSSCTDDTEGRQGEEPPEPDIYAYANDCMALEDAATGQLVRADGEQWRADADLESAAGFRLQATALGAYLLYGPGGEMIAASGTERIATTSTPGPPADWAVDADGPLLTLTNIETAMALGVDDSGVLAQGAVSDTARWEFVPTEGCDLFPDIDPGATGEPFVGESPDSPVRGFLDAHTHVSAFRFQGGNFHCGRPWSPYGPEVALADCEDHVGGGQGALVEALLSNGSLGGEHNTDGWPTFEGWPAPSSLTHEGTYWRWIERAWRGGLRLMVNHVVENRALCEIYPGGVEDCDEMLSARQQVEDMYGLQDYIDAQFGGPGKGFLRVVDSPTEARRVINEGKLAVVLGIEVSEVLGCGLDGEEPRCDEAQIDEGLDELHELGIRTVYPVHKFDNALGGTAYDGGLQGLLVNAGNHHVTGEWWSPGECSEGTETDNTVLSPAGVFESLAEPITELFDINVNEMIEDDPPLYSKGPHCNPRGLTDLGRYAINGLADRGMIVETDHLSVRGRDEALEILEEREYPGVVTSHGWGDLTSQRRIVDLGGVVAPYASSLPGFVRSWREAKEMFPPEAHFGIGYGTDTNGLGSQPSPRTGNEKDPVVYPYTTFDGGTRMDAQVSGERTFDVNTDGVAHYGLFPDWIEDMRALAGDAIVDDLAQGAEAYLRMWEKAANGNQSEPDSPTRQPWTAPGDR